MENKKRTINRDDIINRANHERKSQLKKMAEGEDSLHFKGSLMGDLVRIVRANRSRNWDKYLVPHDWEIINGSVLASDWYPIGSFRRIGEAVFREIAGSNLDNVRKFGKKNISKFLKMYKNIVETGNPANSILRLIESKEMLLRGEILIQVKSSGLESLQCHITRPPHVPEKELFEAFCYESAGLGEAIIEAAGAKKAASSIEHGEEGCNITFKWEML